MINSIANSLIYFIKISVFVREPETLIVYDRNFDQIAPVSLFYDNTAPNPEEVTKEIREYYFDGQPITMSLFQNLTDVCRAVVISKILFTLNIK